MLQYLVFAGALINIIGVFGYVRDTLRGTTKPNRVTWLMWSVAPLIASAAALSHGPSWAILPVFMAGFCPLLVFLASFVNPHSYWELGPFDYGCGLLSALALALWGLTNEPVLAIIFAIGSDALAAVPTLLKSWRYPETESVIAYVTGFLNAVTSFAAVRVWGFAELAFPLYLVVANATLTLVITRHIFAPRPRIRDVR